MKKFFSGKKGQKGFTLIELLIVIAILGILAAVAIPNVANFITSGHYAAANAEVAAVQTALQGYLADNPDASGTIAQADVIPYMANVTALKGTYTLDADGSVTPTASGYADVPIADWDGTKYVKGSGS